MRDDFGHFSQQWAAAVVNFGQRMIDLDLWPAAIDAAGWLDRIVNELAPYAATDGQARTTILAMVRWQEAGYTAVGDTNAATQAARVTATIEPPGP